MVLIPLLILGRQFASTDTTRSIVLRSSVIGICFFIFGVAVEVLQKFSGRDASIHDIIANGWGILAGVLFYFAVKLWRYPDSAFSVFVLVSLSICSIGAASREPLLMLHDVWSMHRNFPDLASFESEMELQRFFLRKCGARQSKQDVTGGERSMEVIYAADPYPAATLVEMVRDWTDLESFEIDVALDEAYTGDSLTFAIRITNANDLSYHGEWTLYPGQPKHVRVTRQEMNAGADAELLDLSNIQYVDLIVIDPIEQVQVRFDSMRLTLNQPET
jgi:hypothetical protein